MNKAEMIIEAFWLLEKVDTNLAAFHQYPDFARDLRHALVQYAHAPLGQSGEECEPCDRQDLLDRLDQGALGYLNEMHDAFVQLRKIVEEI